MITDLRAYPEYEDSGSEWLAAVPSHWQVRNLRTLTRSRNERNRPDLPLLSVAREKGVFARSLTDRDENHNVIPQDLSNYKVARAGDLVINKMKAWQGSMGIAPSDGIVSPAYFVFELYLLNLAFAEALLRSKPYVAHFGQASDGVRIDQWDLSISGMRQIPILIPPADEQNGIVRFLNHANQRVERAMLAKKKLIALLKEQKRAIIHRAVTSGLDTAVTLRPTDIPWLGKIPKHWEVLRLGYLIQLLTGFAFASDGFSHNEKGVPLLRGINVTPSGIRWDAVVRWERKSGDRFEEFQLQAGDIVLGMDRPIIGPGVRAAPVQEKDLPALLVQRVARLRPTTRVDARFLLLLLQTRIFADYMAPIFSGVSVPHLSPKQIKGFKVMLPPLDEQVTLADFVESETSTLTTAISCAEREIGLLREYRNRLVTDVVTGKLDVRAAASHLAAEKGGLSAPIAAEDLAAEAELDPEASEAETQRRPGAKCQPLTPPKKA